MNADPALERLERLASVLEKEQQALVANEPERLGALLEEKRQCIRALEDSTLGTPTRSIQDQPQAAALVQRVAELNLMNGSLIETHRARVRASLSALGRGDQGNACYGPGGQTKDSPGGGFTAAA